MIQYSINSESELVRQVLFGGLGRFRLVYLGGVVLRWLFGQGVAAACIPGEAARRLCRGGYVAVFPGRPRGGNGTPRSWRLQGGCVAARGGYVAVMWRLCGGHLAAM